MRLLFCLFTIAFCLFCRQKEPPVFKNLPASATGVEFKNELFDMDSISVLEFEYMFNGAGCAIFDYDNDGRNDLFFCGNMVPSRLYKNLGGLKFEDVTEKAGIKTDRWCYGASVVDVNQDGWKDLYIAVAGNRKTPPAEMENYFFINNGANSLPSGEGRGGVTFDEKAREMGLAENGFDVQSAFFDADGDGDLDLYLLRNAFVSYNRNQIRKKQLDGLAESNDKLFRNNGADKNGIIHFEDVSAKSGITIEGFGLGVSACDLNEDGAADIYATNDFLTNDLIWAGDGRGKFENRASKYLKHQSYNAMGHDLADFNNDGLIDIISVDMLPPDNKRWKLTMLGNRFDEHFRTLEWGYEPQFVRNMLQLNTGAGPDGEPTFSEIGQMAGVAATEWSWAPLFADLDNDGWKDLFISNGYRQDLTNLDFIHYGKGALFMGTPEGNRKERINELKKYPGIHVPNVVFRNRRDLTFEDVSKKWGLADAPSYSNGAAYGDLDGDGDLDLVVNNLDQTASIFENTTAQRPLQGDKKSHFLRLKMDGDAPNRDGYGSKIWLFSDGGKLQRADFAPVRGYLSTMEQAVHFGLEKGEIDSLRIVWPDGREQVLKNPKADETLVLHQKEAKKLPKVAANAGARLRLVPSISSSPTTATQTLGIDFLHEEDAFLDFKTQALLPHLHSRLGPPLAVADVNGDGLEDFLVGAAAGFQRKMFVQKKDGTFRGEFFNQKNTADDAAFAFFDADGDGDQDFFAAAGGPMGEKAGNPAYSSQLFLNDGKGKFTKNAAFPPLLEAMGCAATCDFDRDGDLDLFVGGRVSPSDYPKTPRSFLLKNEGGKFTDATPEFLKKAGMIAAAVWADVDKNGFDDLILAGEFTPILVFRNEKGSLAAASNPQSAIAIPQSKGWWSALAAFDFDGDGDLDLAAGNRGLNGFFKASPTEPMRVYGGDFDKNGSIDPISTCVWDGVEQIAHTRDDLNKQITAMRARFRNYTEFAERPFLTSFLKDELAAAQKLEAETFASAILENDGTGHFSIKNLPNEAQMAPIFSFLPTDANGDGHLDLLAVGNNFSNETQMGRYDAQASFALFGDGRGGWKWSRRFFYMDGDAKSLARVRLGDGASLLLVGRNSGRLAAFKMPKK